MPASNKSATAAADPRLPRLRQQVADLQRRLDAVPEGPSEETVHRLRTGTRRSGALLQSLLAGHRDSAAARELKDDAEKLLRQWKKLRRAAGEVRDLDVHRGLLAKLRKTWTASATPDLIHPHQHQMDHLDAWLKHERNQRAERLKKETAHRAARCASLTPVVLAALEKSAPKRYQSVTNAASQLPASLALEDFFHTSYAMPTLNRDNLHDFRKRTKEARYVAEAGGPESHAALVANALKRIQDSIGDWHDLDALVIEARQALGNEGAELAAKLEARAALQLQQALLTAEKMRHRLLGERLALKAASRKRIAVR